MQAAIIQETAGWIVLNKPAGLLSIPDREGKEPSLKSYLQKQYGEIFTVHRLDRETSGLILFAKTRQGALRGLPRNAVTVAVTIGERLRNARPGTPQWLTNKVNLPRTL